MPVKYDEYYSAQDHALGPAFKDVIAFFQNLEVGQTVLDVGLDKGGMQSRWPKWDIALLGLTYPALELSN